jgi:hypothetical protein
MDVDVIGQGREPERDYRPLSGRWRVAGWALAIAAGVAVLGFGLRHGAGSAGSGLATATAPPPVSAPLVPGYELPLPQRHPAVVVCSPSSGSCSMRVIFTRPLP